VWERLPSCNKDLVEKSGKCLVRVSGPDFDDQVRTEAARLVDSTRPTQRAMKRFADCMNTGGRQDDLERAVRQTNAKRAMQTVSQCLSGDVRRDLSTGPDGRADYFQTLTVTMGGNLTLNVDGGVEAGIAVDLNGRNGPRLYTASGFGGGSVVVGADIIVGLSVDPMRPSIAKGVAATGSAKYIAGVAMSVTFDRGSPLTFDGLSISAGAGIGGGFPVSQTDSRIW
jgi:hypothetical protein